MAAENGILGRGEDVGVARRNVLKRSGALAAAWVIGTVGLAAHAQQRDRPRKIGVIMNYAENDLEGQARFSALREQLHKLGSVDGNNTQIEVRWAAGKSDLMLAFATQFVSQPVDVIVVNSTPLLTVLSACDPKRLRPRISAAVYPTTSRDFRDEPTADI